MMKVVIVTAVFPPEPVVSAQIARDLADELFQRKASVTVLCPYPTRPIGAKFIDCPKSPMVRKETYGGVTVVRLPSYASPESRMVSRMRESLSFGYEVGRYLASNANNVDVVYANPWPLFGSALIAWVCSRYRIPFILHIQDIYPEALERKMPRWLFSCARVVLTALDQWTIRSAACVVVISDNMRRVYTINRGLAKKRVITILNWIDESRFGKVPARSEVCSHYGIPSDLFTFLYFGNIGPVAGVEGIIEAFHMAGLKQAQLVIAGDGSAKKRCIEVARKLETKHVHFISDPDASSVPAIQSIAHVCLLPMLRGAGMSSVPSKLMAYLFSAKPVIATIDALSDTARCIREAQCGWVGEAEDTEWLARKMADVCALGSSDLEKIGRRGWYYGQKCFSKSAGVSRFSDLIQSVAGFSRTPI